MKTEKYQSSQEPEGRARHPVRAGIRQWENGAQGIDAPYLANWFMAPMRVFGIVENSHEPERRSPTRHAECTVCCRVGDRRSTPRLMVATHVETNVGAFHEPFVKRSG